MNEKEKTVSFPRGAGILMPISALPSPYGIGGFGKSAFEFADFLAETKNKYWQVLPLNPTSYGDSPYQSPASMAGNPYFIDLEILQKKGLLAKSESSAHKSTAKRVDYGRLFETRYPLLRLAYSRFLNTEKEQKEYEKFLKNTAWLSDYALFMALKCRFNHSAWTMWPAEYRDINSARERAAEFSSEMGFWCWVQYEFDAQWRALRSYARKRGVSIIGDMPIYVAHDSMDVWRAPNEFLLDDNYAPRRVAGCPPDGFSPDGQLWGNPIYNWNRMKNDGFGWWKERIGEGFRLYDLLRIDHFRGFAGYYSIPYGHDTAREGEWREAPGKELFREIKRAFPEAKIIAEDLGFITDDVRELLSDTGFPGMKILQFAFYDEDSEYLPRCYKDENCIAYTGSHDSECTRSFCLSLEGETLARFKRECPHKKGQSLTLDLIGLTLSSKAAIAVIPIQDYLELKSEEGRMNTPSTAEGNWTFRLGARYKTPALKQKIKTAVKQSNRI